MFHMFNLQPSKLCTNLAFSRCTSCSLKYHTWTPASWRPSRPTPDMSVSGGSSKTIANSTEIKCWKNLVYLVLSIKNFASFQGTKFVPHKTWNHPTSHHPKPYRNKKKLLPCLFSPGCRRLYQSFHRPGFGRWSREECHPFQRYLCSNEWRLHDWATLEPRAAWDLTKRVWKEVWDLWWNWKFDGKW